MTTPVLVVLAVLAKALGFSRDVLLAYAFGADRSTDVVFLVANVWLGLSIALAASLSIIVVPAVVHRCREATLPEAGRLVWSLLLLGVVILTAVAAGVIVGAERIVLLFNPDLSAADRRLAARFFEITAMVLPLTVTAGVLGAYLRSRGRYFWAEAPLICINAGSVAGLALFGRSLGVTSLAWGMVCGAAASLLLLGRAALPSLGRPRITRADLQESLPMLASATILTLFGHSGGYLAGFVESLFTMRLPGGQLSLLSYGRRVLYLPVQLLSPAVLTPKLTETSVMAHEEDLQAIRDSARQTVFRLMYVVLPLMVLFAVYSEHVVRLVFFRGSFDEQAVRRTAAIAVALIPVPLISIVKNVLANLFFALRLPRVPVAAGAVWILTFATVTALGWRTYGVWGVIAGQITADLLATSVLGALCSRRTGLGWRWLPAWLARLTPAVGTLALVAWALREIAKTLGLFSGYTGSLIACAVAGAASLLAFVGVSRWCAIREPILLLAAARDVLRETARRPPGSAGRNT